MTFRVGASASLSKSSQTADLLSMMTDISFRVPLNNQWARKPRKLRVVCIGAGLAGVTLSYKIGHELKLEDAVELQIYERQVSEPF